MARPKWHYVRQCPPLRQALLAWESLFLPFYVFFCVCLHQKACGILVPRPGIKPTTPTMEAWNLFFSLILFFSIFQILFYFYFFFSFIFINWRLITSQHCSGFGHTLTWISHGVTCIPHPDPPSHLPLHRIPLGLPSAPGPSTCLRSMES